MGAARVGRGRRDGAGADGRHRQRTRFSSAIITHFGGCYHFQRTINTKRNLKNTVKKRKRTLLVGYFYAVFYAAECTFSSSLRMYLELRSWKQTRCGAAAVGIRPRVYYTHCDFKLPIRDNLIYTPTSKEYPPPKKNWSYQRSEATAGPPAYVRIKQTPVLSIPMHRF